MIFDDLPYNPFPVFSRRLMVRPYTHEDLPQMAARHAETAWEVLSPREALEAAQENLMRYHSLSARREIVVGGFSLADGRTLMAHFNAVAIGPGIWDVGYYVPQVQRGQGVMAECLQVMKRAMGMMDARALTAHPSCPSRAS